MFNNTQTRNLLPHAILVFSAIIILTISLVILFLNYHSRIADIQQGHQDARRLIKSIADDIELNFVTVDLTLSKAVDRQYLNALFGNRLKKDISLNLFVWL